MWVGGKRKHCKALTTKKYYKFIQFRLEVQLCPYVFIFFFFFPWIQNSTHKKALKKSIDKKKIIVWKNLYWIKVFKKKNNFITGRVVFKNLYFGSLHLKAGSCFHSHSQNDGESEKVTEGQHDGREKLRELEYKKKKKIKLEGASTNALFEKRSWKPHPIP